MPWLKRSPKLTRIAKTTLPLQNTDPMLTLGIDFDAFTD